MAWAVLAAAHVTQAIWLSGGAAYPGDLWDGRFNQLVLEHGYKALRGAYAWASPGAFHPIAGTLALSDTHAGTLPLYAGLRWLGVSRDDAWIGWFLVVSALNVWAAFRLFRALRIHPLLQGPLVFACAGSALMAWLAGTHMQMLPVFPALLAGEQAVRWVETRRLGFLARTVGLLGWQFATAPYVAFFSLLLGGLVFAARMLIAGPTMRATVPPVPVRSRWLWDGAILAAGLTAGGFVLSLYFRSLNAGHTRSFLELQDLAPTVRSWLTAAPTFWWYGRGGFGQHPNVVEHSLFLGVLPWLGGVVAVFWGWRQRRIGAGAWSLAFAVGAIAAVLLITAWSSDVPGLWLAASNHIEALRAFRSIGRIAVLLPFLLCAAIGLVLTHGLATSRSQSARILIVMVAVAAALETVAHRQPSTRRDVAVMRTKAMVAAWAKAGDRPILAFAPGYTNEGPAMAHLDAWSAALQLSRRTLNGYSGGIPASHMQFWWNPTSEMARMLIASQGIPPSQVSLVDSWDQATEERLGITRRQERPVTKLDGFDLQPFRWKLSGVLETFAVEGRVMHQFTPPAELAVRLPDGARGVAYDVAMRDGSYSGAGHSDGVGITWILRRPQAGDITLHHEHFNPRDKPEDRGVQRRSLAVPTGPDRILILRVDTGPDNSAVWDWPLFGSLRAE